MFGLDLSHLSPQLEGAVEALITALTALILFLLVKLVKSCLEDEKCRPTVIAGQGALEELQDSMSETERGERLEASRRRGATKKRGPSKDLGSEEARDKGKDALGEKRGKEEKNPKKKSLYPVKELEALGLDSSETDELSPSEEEDLEDEAARYEEERYHPDSLSKKQKKAGGGNHVVSRPVGPSAPPPYMERFYSDSFLTRDEQKKIRQAFPVFEAAEGGRVHAPAEYIQIKELAELVRNYGVSANFTISQVERLAALAMTPGDWQTTVKAVLPNMGQYMEWKALWYDASQAQAKVNAIAEGDQRNWTLDLLTGQGQYANNQTNDIRSNLHCCH